MRARIFLLTFALMVGALAVWLTALWQLEWVPRALQSAERVGTLVNLTRTALMNAEPEAWTNVVGTLIDRENVRIAPREAADEYLPYAQDSLSTQVADRLHQKLGDATVVARSVNGFEGLWIAMDVHEDRLWVLVDPSRIDRIGETTWLVWLASGTLWAALGAAAIAAWLSRPLHQLAQAAQAVRQGRFDDAQLNAERHAPEVNAAFADFNTMASQIAHMEQERSLMLSGISHDIKTPLARLRLGLTLAVPDDATRAPMEQDVEDVARTVDQFADFARPLSGQRMPVPLGATLAAALERVNAEHTQVVLQGWSPNEGEAWVLALPTELRRVLQNLLHNAAKYARPSGHGLSPAGAESTPDGSDAPAQVDVTLTPDGPDWCLTLTDHGPGVPPEALGQLTTPFFRVVSARTNAQGSGLGLAIVRQLTQRMGGRLAIDLAPHGGLQVRLWWERAPG